VSQEKGPEQGTQPEAGAQQEKLPAIDFSTFILSLSSSALYHMGLFADPESGERAEPNLPVARQTIDTLELLREKTRGNLTDEESKLFDSLLYDLRMRFVELER
jgi:hypothetical protein